MCGIVGYTGYQNARNIVIDGLKTLEYRGYDSAGIALAGDDGELTLYKSGGRVRELDRSAPYTSSHTAIGHTRWATHGEPNARNSHPHLSFDGELALVHNGIIENCAELKTSLLARGISFSSDTDSEIIAHFLATELRRSDAHTEKDIIEAVYNVAEKLDGAATFLFIRRNDDKIYCFRRGASLAVAAQKGECFAASDTLAITAYTRDVIVLKDNECAVLSPSGITLYDDRGKFFRSPVTVNRLAPPEYNCFMRSEIDEIPSALLRTYESYLNFRLPEGSFDKICISGCGTAYHAGLYGKEVIENLAGIPVEVHVASEFSRARFVSKSTLAVFISQSGETADTLFACRRAQTMGAATVAVTNVEDSTLAMQADAALYIDAGAEVAVAATKSYNCQLLALYLIALSLSGKSPDYNSIAALSRAAEDMACANPYEEKVKNATLFFLGKGRDEITAREGALKFKEITYKPAEAYALGELKHGAIALIDKNSYAVIVATDEREKYKISLGISELKSRGATTVAISAIGDVGADKTLCLPYIPDAELYNILSVIPLQTLALNTSLALGLNPDKPRNLAKSVTVI